MYCDLSSHITNDLEKIIGISGRIRENFPLAPFTTWRVGGAADMLVEPATKTELIATFQYSLKLGLPFTIIGRGSNILIDDAGIRGIVICLKNSFNKVYFDQENHTFKAQAGCHLARFAVAAAKQGVSGFEFLICIPGTVGAAVAINAGIGGVNGPCIKDILLDATILNPVNGVIETLQAEDLGLIYRNSNILEKRLWVIEATFCSNKTATKESINLLHKEILNKRATKQPLNKRTCGSTFKQPTGGKPAGWYIDRAGLKGFRVGGASVSTKHANWIENDGTATAADIKNLINHIQKSVFNKFDVILEREVRYLPQDMIINYNE